MLPALEKLFLDQHGIALVSQALENGESYETIARRVRDNDWCRPLPRVLAPVGAPLTFNAKLSAARLSIGGEMAFGGATAAAIWSAPGSWTPERIHVVVGDKRNVRSSELVRVQRQSSLLDKTYTRDDWPVVSVEAAVVGMAAAICFPQLVDCVQELLRLGRTTTQRLLARTGRGVSGSSAVAAAGSSAGDGFGSKWERRLAHYLRSADLSPRAQYRVTKSDAVAYLDLAFPDAKLAVEIDGYVAHTRPEAFRHDRVRQNMLVAALGWTLLRYTPYEIARRPDRVVSEIRAALAQAS